MRLGISCTQAGSIVDGTGVPSYSPILQSHHTAPSHGTNTMIKIPYAESQKENFSSLPCQKRVRSGLSKIVTSGAYLARIPRNQRKPDCPGSRSLESGRLGSIRTTLSTSDLSYREGQGSSTCRCSGSGSTSLDLGLFGHRSL